MLFLEPEWSGSNQIYLNGFSTSLSEKIQKQALRAIPALEKVEFIRAGYAIEYDYSPPYQLNASLMSKSIQGLFFAGQINGTSGYEEAAAQGLISGANALLYTQNKSPFVLPRDSSYIGVMIDDLITSHLDEPYRMFTSRSEHRLSLRPDNCYERLVPKALSFNLLTADQKKVCNLLFKETKKVFSWVEKHKIKKHNQTVAAKKHIKRPEVSLFNIIPKQYRNFYFFKESVFAVETNIKYEGYIINERQRILSIQKLEKAPIPKNFNYDLLQGLSNESKLRLNRVRPETLGQASRISGIRPTDITLIGINIKKVSRET